MLAETLAAYTRDILDDPDQVFLPNSRLARFLELAYNEFRNKVPQEVYEITYQPGALTATATVNLDNVMFGSAPTQRRCQRITRVIMVDPTTGLLQFVMKPASSYESLAPVLSSAAGAFMAYGSRWWLDGRTLRFSCPVTGTIQIVYLPQQNINWSSAIVSGANVYIDDLEQFHDIIALLAAQHYAAADGAMVASIQSRLANRLNDLQEFFAQTRSGQGSRYVLDDDGASPWGSGA